MDTIDIAIEEGEQVGDTLGLRAGGLLRVSLRADLAGLGDVLLMVRALRGLNGNAARYPIYRLVRSAARRPLDELFDDLAQRSGLVAHRLGEGTLLLDGPGVLVNARGRRKTDYASLTFAIWAAGQMGLTSAEFEELADPTPADEACPTLGEPVAQFIDRYLAARETVLIVQGPPGTGKTRFVRAVLAAISRRKGYRAETAARATGAHTRSLQRTELRAANGS